MTIPETITLPELCHQRITDLLASGRRRILGIVAAPGAGKSTLAQAIATQFGQAVQVVPMDGFHLANSELLRLGRRGRKGAPDTFDAAGYVNLMRRLKAQAPDEVVYAPDYRREVEEAIAGAIAVFPTTQLIVTEGNYLLLANSPWWQIKPLLDLSVFIDVPRELVRARLTHRHAEEGLFSEERNREHIERVDLANYDLVHRSRPRADLAIDLVVER